MANQPHSKFRVTVLAALIAALAVAILLMARIALNRPVVTQLTQKPTSNPAATLTAAAPASPAATTPAQMQTPPPTPTEFVALADAPPPTVTPTPLPPAQVSRGDRLSSPLPTPVSSLAGRLLCMVNTTPLNLQEGPGDDYGLILALSNGTSLAALKQAAGAAWVLVETTTGQVGWVYGAGLTCPDALTGLPAAAGLVVQTPVMPSPSPTLPPRPPATPTAAAVGSGPPPADPNLPPLSQDYWRGEYYSNASLEGEPVLVRQDPVELEFNWFLDSPAPGLPADNFSVRWQRLVDFRDGGDAIFYADADDGVKIWVDDQLAVNNWNLYAPITYQGAAYDLSPGLHTVTVEYFESGGYARIKVWGDRAQVQDPAWEGRYYANPDLREPPVLVRQDESIDFDWGDDEPIDGLGRSDFSIRWERTIYFDQTGDHRLFARVDDRDRARIFLDGWLLADDYKDDGGTVEGYFGDLGAGFHTVVVEYVDEGGDASIKFDWERD